MKLTLYILLMSLFFSCLNTTEKKTGDNTSSNKFWPPHKIESSVTVIGDHDTIHQPAIIHFGEDSIRIGTNYYYSLFVQFFDRKSYFQDKYIRITKDAILVIGDYDLKGNQQDFSSIKEDTLIDFNMNKTCFWLDKSFLEYRWQVEVKEIDSGKFKLELGSCDLHNFFNFSLYLDKDDGVYDLTAPIFYKDRIQL